MLNVPARPPSPVEGENRVPAWEPPPTVPSGPPNSKDAAVRLSLRLVVQLSRWGPPADGGVARLESTQQGLAQDLSTTQGAVSKVLARLVAAEIVRPERRHVRGVERQIRVYYLTAMGEALAREVRERFGLAPPFSGPL